MPEILWFDYSLSSTSFYDTFKMTAIEITYLGIIRALSQILIYMPMFLGMRNTILIGKCILKSTSINMFPRFANEHFTISVIGRNYYR